MTLVLKFLRKRARPTPYLPVPAHDRPSTVSESEHQRCRNILFGIPAPEPFAQPDDEERELWRTGKLVPWYITCRLDGGRHNGPEVDIACHAEEPAVDNWELGRLYPNWGQTVALARLLNVRVRNLTHPEAHPHHQPERPVRRPGRHIAILSFEPSAVQAVCGGLHATEGDN
ncbi:hypothetical protein [Rhodococcus qingshengii]|uniref:hypothetical protein n=2 Tax=Rhodococcus TaxID=1827 RepID=UPI00211E5703|nr:hypothetical protein [Rhodococcus qingshengii]MDJ0434682.1 hypothetical protein [Rhodococcus qingshengii]